MMALEIKQQPPMRARAETAVAEASGVVLSRYQAADIKPGVEVVARETDAGSGR